MPEILDPSEIMFSTWEPKQLNRFIMYIDGIPSFIIKAADRPKLTSSVTVLDHINVDRKVKGKSRWQDITITLYDPIVPSGAQAVMEWIRLSHESVTGRDGYFDFYGKDITFNALGPVGDKVEQWVLKGAWVNDVDFNSFDWSNDGEAVTITITLSYNYAILDY